MKSCKQSEKLSHYFSSEGEPVPWAGIFMREDQQEMLDLNKQLKSEP